MPCLSRESILAVSDLKTQKVETPEWGEDAYVFVREMDGYGRLRFELAAKEGILTDETLGLILSLTVCDEAGHLLFPGDSGAREITGKSSDVLMRLFNAAIDLNKVTKEHVDELEKN
jgi:hypothetical protein